MKTQTFIEKQAGIILRGENSRGHCASVFAERDTIYSYGYHYPLLFKVTTPGGKVLMVLNRSGYSNTTSKHINWCYGSYDVSCEFKNDYPRNYEGVILSLLNEHDRITAEMNSKKRKDTAVYKRLEWDLNRVNEALTKLEHGS